MEPNNTAKEIGYRLKEARKKKKLKQIEVAKMLGIHNTTLARYEAGSRHPDYDTITKLADLYDVTTDYLLAGKIPKGIDTEQLMLDLETGQVVEPDIVSEIVSWNKLYKSAVFHMHTTMKNLDSASLSHIKLVDEEILSGLLKFLSSDYKKYYFISNY